MESSIDGCALCLGPQNTEFSETPSPDSDSVNSLEGHSEPSWFKDIKFDDSDTEQLADENDYTTPGECFGICQALEGYGCSYLFSVVVLPFKVVNLLLDLLLCSFQKQESTVLFY